MLKEVQQRRANELPQKDILRANLEATSTTYSLEENAVFAKSGHTKDQVIDYSLYIMAQMEISPEFTHSPLRNIVLLSIADQLLSYSEKDEAALTERKALHTMLKLVANGYDSQGEYGTFSERVRRQSSTIQTGQMFDPRYARASEVASVRNSLFDFASSREKPMPSEFQEVVSQLAMSIGMRLGLTPTEVQERLASIRVLSVDASEQEMLSAGKSPHLADGASGIAYMHERNGIRYVLVNSENRHVLEHELVHALGASLDLGYYRVLLQGLREAITEDATTQPTTYSDFRDILHCYVYTLFDSQEEGQRVARAMYRGDESARDQLFTKMLARYGFAGFSDLLRLSPPLSRVSTFFALSDRDVRKRLDTIMEGSYRRVVYRDGSRKTEKWVFVPNA